ncbi:MAG: right-handed parallel beta-helix repeat-containing protein, partial [Sedimentisphaerales bacterium]|nr:right-handed parallel beta-helix repeat-containing protein [Sedimentisphaerales bacterium]
GDAGLGEWYEMESGDVTESTGGNANIYHADVADFEFNAWSDDSDYNNDDFSFTHILTEAMGTGYITPASFEPDAVPGDTIIIDADRVSGILLRYFDGTVTNPYIFTNPSDATVTINGVGTTKWGSQGLQIFDSDNFKVLGNSYSGATYGIEIHGLTNPKGGIRMWRCADWEVAYIHIHDTYAGISQNNNDPWTQANSMGSCRIHHCLIEDTSGIFAEGMYLGKSKEGDHPHWDLLEIDHNKVYRTGSDCIQAGQTESLLIHDNYCKDCGIQNDVNQNIGINLSVEAGGIEIYRNMIIRARHNGIDVNYTTGVDPSIHDNVIWDAGYGGDGNGIKVTSVAGSATVINNTVVSAHKYGIKTYTSDTTGEIRYNLLVANGSGGISSAYSTQNDNRTAANTVTEHFVSAATANFRLTTSSPARDAGIGAGYSTIDYDGNTRPHGSAPDIGAHEYYSPSELADLNDNGEVNLEDFAVFASYWMNENVCSVFD